MKYAIPRLKEARLRLRHVINEIEWKRALISGAIVKAPFLHCCTAEQLAFVLAHHFGEQSCLLVLRFEAESLAHAVRWVKSEPDQDPFPHLYASLPIDLITQVDQIQN